MTGASDCVGAGTGGGASVVGVVTGGGGAVVVVVPVGGCASGVVAEVGSVVVSVVTWVTCSGVVGTAGLVGSASLAGAARGRRERGAAVVTGDGLRGRRGLRGGLVPGHARHAARRRLPRSTGCARTAATTGAAAATATTAGAAAARWRWWLGAITCGRPRRRRR